MKQETQKNKQICLIRTGKVWFDRIRLKEASWANISHLGPNTANGAQPKDGWQIKGGTSGENDKRFHTGNEGTFNGLMGINKRCEAIEHWWQNGERSREKEACLDSFLTFLPICLSPPLKKLLEIICFTVFHLLNERFQLKLNYNQLIPQRASGWLKGVTCCPVFARWFSWSYGASTHRASCAPSFLIIFFILYLRKTVFNKQLKSRKQTMEVFSVFLHQLHTSTLHANSHLSPHGPSEHKQTSLFIKSPKLL